MVGSRAESCQADRNGMRTNFVSNLAGRRFIWAIISAVILGGAFYFDRVLR